MEERTEFLINDRLSFMHFLGHELSDPLPDARTIRTFREELTRAKISVQPAIEVLLETDEAVLRKVGFPATGGQIGSRRRTA